MKKLLPLILLALLMGCKKKVTRPPWHFDKCVVEQKIQIEENYLVYLKSGSKLIQMNNAPRIFVFTDKDTWTGLVEHQAVLMVFWIDQEGFHFYSPIPITKHYGEVGEITGDDHRVKVKEKTQEGNQ